MTGLKTLSLAAEYRTGESDPVSDFYTPSLLASIQYDRAVGYFRSTLFAIIGQPFLDFALRGGKCRLVCSPDLSDEDMEALGQAYSRRDATLSSALIREIGTVVAFDSAVERLRVLATLVKTGVIDIRIAHRPGAQGIFHEKLGIFSDSSGNQVSFKGSANETLSAWHPKGNFESIDVFSSYGRVDEAERVANHVRYFERLWRGKVSGVEVLSYPEAAKQELLKHSDDALEAKLIGTSRTRPTVSLFAHQQSAIRGWEEAGKRGIFEHATGSGKTITALAIMKEHGNLGLPSLVVVPSRLLLKQWALEIKRILPPDFALMLAGGGNTDWRTHSGLITKFLSSDPSLGPRVVVATMHTAAMKEFQSKLSEKSKLLLVADEVHQVGSAELSNVLSLDAKFRLGLSATPKRYGDPEGTAKIFDYFNAVIPPPYSLEDAVRDKRLVPYFYHPRVVTLTHEESEKWKEISQEIGISIASSKDKQSGEIRLSSRAKMLLMMRARIAKSAERKASLAADILKEKFKKGQRWLVYCEDSNQLEKVRKEIGLVGISAMEYHTGMDGDPAATLEAFANFEGILLAIRCLDEGVDIPAIDHAIILASSQNPRQFIQRRGRVLRVSPGKTRATIYDALVRPAGDSSSAQIGYFRAEVARALEFASLAANPACVTQLQVLAAEVGVDLDTSFDVPIEEEDGV